MVERSPTVGVDDIYVSFTVENRIQHGCLFQLWLFGQNGLMNGCLRLYRSLGVDVFSTIDEVDKVARIGGHSGIIQVLKNTSCKFIFSDLQWSLSVVSRGRLSSKIREEPRGLKVSEVGAYVEWRMLV